MIQAHDAFLEGWERGVVLSREALIDAARAETGDSGISTWVEQTLADDEGGREIADFQPDYGDAVLRDRERLDAIRGRLAGITPDTDPKLTLLVELLEASPADKVVVFATYGETIEYLDERLPAAVGGRERVVVGGTSTPDERTRLISRFAPHTVVGPDYEPADGEVGLLLSTDVLSEGQNLQQAQAVISYDMPWNPQRVVQRNGRVIRLLSPHEEVFLTTMLPEPGDLEEMLRLETLVRAKIRAAGVYGMEVEVIDGIESDLRQYAERLAGGDVELLADEDDGLSGAFLGELLRAKLLRAQLEGELARIEGLPWGIGAAFRQTSGGRSRGTPGCSSQRGRGRWTVRRAATATGATSRPSPARCSTPTSNYSGESIPRAASLRTPTVSISRALGLRRRLPSSRSTTVAQTHAPRKTRSDRRSASRSSCFVTRP